MKQFIGLILLALILISCNDDITNVYQQESSSSAEALVSSSSVAILCSSSSSEIEAPISSEFIESSSSEFLIESSSSLTIVSSSSLVTSSSDVPSSSSVTASSSSIVVESSSSSIEYGKLTDSRDGQTYKTVVIGTQTWMAQNLNYAVDSSWCYENSAKSCTKYGRLYQWASAMKLDTVYNHTTRGGSDVNHQGICPDGWHLPNGEDWQTLYDYVDLNNGTESVITSLKSTGEWASSSGLATGTNGFGFSAFPAGFRDGDGNFGNAGYNADFWSATEYYSYYANYWSLYFHDGAHSDKNFGFSVRCLKN